MASINHSVLGILSSAHPVPVAGGVWASLSPLCSRTLAHRWEFWGIHVCLSLWKMPTFVDALLANVGCEFLGAEHWGDGIHPSPRPGLCSRISQSNTGGQPTPKELDGALGIHIPADSRLCLQPQPFCGTFCCPQARLGSREAQGTELSWDFLLAQRMGHPWQGTGWAQTGTGDPQGLLPPPLPRVLEQQPAHARGTAGKCSSRRKSPIFPALLALKPELEPFWRAEPPSPLPPE